MKRIIGGMGCLACWGAAALWAADGTWTGSVDGAWSTTANWAGGTVASGAGSVATLSNLAGPIRITNDVASLKLKGAVTLGGAYTIYGQPLTVEGVATGNNGLVASNGTFVVASAVNLNTNLQVQVESGAGLTTSGLLDYLGAYTITKKGVGEWVYSGTCFETNSGYYFDVAAGSVRFAAGSTFTVRGGNRENFRVGYNGGGLPGRVTVERGAALNIAGFVLGYDVVTAKGTLVVDGGTFSANTTDAGNPILVGRMAVGVFSVSNSAAADIANWFNLGVYNRGELNIGSGGTMSAGRMSFGWMTQDNAAHTGLAAVVVGSGLLSVTNQFVWRTATLAARTNSVVLGNGQQGSATLRLPATVKTDGDAGYARLAVDGGTLQMIGVRDSSLKASLTNYLYGLNQLLIGHAGLVLDTTNTTLTITQAIQRDPALRSDGGITKVGSGRLTLAGGCAYSGPTLVAQGTLRLAGALPTNAVVVLPGASLSVVDGQYRAFAPPSFTAGVGGASGLELEAGAGSLCDTLVLPSDASVGALSVALVAANGVSSYWLPGDYVVAAYAGTAPDVSGWTTTAPTGVTATFELQPSQKRVVLHVSGSTSTSVWLKAGSGAWSTAANWTTAPVSDPATAVLFGGAPGAAASVGVGSPVTVGSMTFDAPDAYALSGATLTFGATGVGGSLSVAQGAHTIAQGVSVPTNLAVAVQAGASLMLGGGAAGAGRIVVTGGGALSVSNGAAVSVPLTVDGATLGVAATSTLGVPLTVGAGGATLTPADGKTATFSGAVDGVGPITKSGASTAVMSGANGGAGARVVRNGTLTLSSLTDGGDLVIGEGTLKYVGPSVSTPKGFTIRTSDAKLGAAFESDADVTFNGAVATESGVFQKYGKGTLTFAGAGTNTIGAGIGSDNYSTVLNRGANGESATQGLRIFMVLDGRVVLGAPNQTNIINNTVVVGGRTTTAGTETAGRLDINGGYLQCGIITVARGNGSASTAPTGLVSVLRINGGVIQSGGIYAGLQLSDMGGALCNARPLVEMNGGTHIGTQLWLGNAAIPVQPKVLFNGGFTAFTGPVAGDVRLAYDGGVTSETVVAGGTLAVSNVLIRIADNSAAAKAVVRLNGGTLITRGFERLGSGVGEVYFNGGVLQPCQSFTLSNLTVAAVQAGGFAVNVPTGMTLTVTQALTHDAALGATPDGGLVKWGSGALVLGGAQSYTGPTAISGGVLRVTGTLTVTNLALASGVTLSLTNGACQVFAPAALALGGAGDPVRVEMDVAANGSASDVLALPSGVSGRLVLGLFKLGSSARFVAPGRYPLATFTGVAPSVADWSVEGMGGTATFEVDGSTVYVRIGNPSGAAVGSVWTNALGGAWSVAGNWSAAPANDASASVLFGSAISGPATVTTGDGVTLGYLAVDSANAYTWSGGALTLGSAASNAAVRVTQGSHTVDAGLALPSTPSVQLDAAATLQVNGAIAGAGSLAVTGGGKLVLTNGTECDVAVALDGVTLGTTLSTTFDTAFTLGAGGAQVAPGAGSTLTLASAVAGAGGLTKTGSSVLVLPGGTTFGGELVVRGGTVAMAAEPGEPLVIGEGTFKYTGGAATFARGYRLRTSATTQAATIASDADLTFSGPVTAESGAFIKLGGGTFTYAYGGANILSAGDNQGTGTTCLNVQPYGDTPTQGYRSYNIFNGKVVLGADGQSNVFSQAVLVGGQSTTNVGAETAGYLDINGGVNVFQDYITVGRGNGTSNTAPAGLESTLTVNGGVSTALGFWMGAIQSNQSTLTARPRFVMNGGSLSTLNLYCGNGGTPKSRIEVNGGTLTVGPNDGMRLVYAAGSDAELTINGGLVVLSNQTLYVADNYAGGRGVVRLNGGRLAANNLFQTGTSAVAVVYFNGGVFEPRATAALGGALLLTNCAGGAIFDVPQGVAYTLGATLTHDAALGAAPDGGLVKLGAGTLVVTNAQAYTGPTVISNGTLAAVAPAGAALTAGTLVLGGAPGTEVGLSLTADRARFLSGGAAQVNGDLVLGKAAVALVYRETGAAPSTNGVYVVASCTGTISGSASDLRLANPVFGRSYAFGVVGNELRLTVGTDAQGAFVWTKASGGAWSESGNWSAAPGAGAAGAAIGFLDAIAGAATVSLDGPATAGSLHFNNANAYTLSGDGSLTLDETNGAPALVAEQGVHTVAVPAALAENTTVAVSNAAELWLTGRVSGDAKLTKTGDGRLLLSGANAYSGGTDVLKGYLDVSGASAAGSGALTFNGGHLAAKGAGVAAVANAATVLQSMQVVTYAPLTLAGSWTASGNIYLAKMSSNELTVAGSVKPAAGSANRLDFREGSVRFASGADVLYTSSATRECIDFRAPASTSTCRALTVEPGANVVTKMLYVGYGATNTVTVNGGVLSLTGYLSSTLDAFIMGAAGTSAKVTDRFYVNGGTVSGADSAWFLMGVDRGRTLLDIAGGTVSLGAVSMGHRTENSIDTGPNAASDVYVRGGLLEARQRWNWMGDIQGGRVNTLYLNGGRLRLPATFAGVSNRINQARLVFNGGTLQTPGGGADAEDAADYLKGLKQAYVGSGGAVLDTLGRSVGLSQRLTTLDGATDGGVIKQGLGTLTLAKPPCVTGRIDVQTGTLRILPEPALAFPDDAAMRLSFESGVQRDDSLYARTIGLIGAASNLTTIAGASGSNALHMSGQNILYADFTSDMTNGDAYTISSWVRQSAYQTDTTQHRTIFGNLLGGNKPHEFLLRIEGGAFRMLGTGAANYSYGSFTADVTNALPLNTWVMLTYVVDGLNGFSMYVNGERRTMKITVNGTNCYGTVYGAGSQWLLQPPARTGGHAFMVGTVNESDTTGFIGDLDDVTVYRRALTPVELAMLYRAKNPCGKRVRVASGATLDLAGATQEVAEVTGEGLIANGTAAVTGAINPGDSAQGPAGSWLSVAGLTLGTNVAYRCDWTPSANDVVDVWGTLTVSGAGTIDLGLTDPSQMPGYPRRKSFPVMYYKDVVGAANFGQWTVVGTGRTAASATVSAAGGVVTVSLDVPSGILMLVR